MDFFSNYIVHHSWISIISLFNEIINGSLVVQLPQEVCVSASSPLVGFGELNNNTIKGLTSLLSVEQEIEFIAYTCGLWNEKCI